MQRVHLVWVGYAVLIVALLCIAFIAGRATAEPSLANAQTGPEVAPLEVEGATSFYCTVNNVAAYETRIHLRCDASPGDGVYYFAYATDPAHFSAANQILAVANTAFALGRPVYVYYQSDSSYNPPGCHTSDCRGLTGVSMVQ